MESTGQQRPGDWQRRHETLGGIIFRQISCYSDGMSNLQVRNIPDDLHERLRRHARENNCTMSAAVLIAVERELARWEWRKRLAQRPKTDLGVEAATLLVEERRLRDMETE